jgi:hypothetical protein
MAITVEDGTGLAGADAYVSVAYFDTYAADRGIALGTMTTAEKEAAIRRATSYVDSEWLYKGYPLIPTQALEFPRTGLVWNNRIVEGVPKRVKDATVELALTARAGPLRADYDRGGAVVSESVGPISVTYADGAAPGKLYAEAAALLQPYTKATRVDPVPFFQEPTTTPLSVGMHDAPWLEQS